MTDKHALVDAGVTPSPGPQFTVSKVSVPKPEASIEVSRLAVVVNIIRLMSV